MKYKLISTALLALLGPANAFSATLLVGPSAPFTTIQSAIDAAAAGDIVSIAPGTYEESLVVENKHLTLKGTEGVVIKGVLADPLTGKCALRIKGGNDFTVVEDLLIRTTAGAIKYNYYNGVSGEIQSMEGERSEDAVILEGAKVRLNNVTVQVYGAEEPENAPPAALVAITSDLIVRGGRFTGANGANTWEAGYGTNTVKRSPTPGGHALEVYSSSLDLRDATFAGGKGGNGNSSRSLRGGRRGGSAVVVFQNSSVYGKACQFTAGDTGGAGFYTVGYAYPEPAGPVLDVRDRARMITSISNFDTSTGRREPAGSTGGMQIESYEGPIQVTTNGSVAAASTCQFLRLNYLLGKGSTLGANNGGDGAIDAADLLVASDDCQFPNPWWVN